MKGFLLIPIIFGVMNKIFVIAGEASGDLHGSNLIKELLKINPTLEIKGWGGDLMQKQGATILKHYKELAFMGFSEVLKNLNTILKNFKICKSQIIAFEPTTIIFIDYPGFNLRMAKWAKERGYKTIYYISPQIWAWKEKRIFTIKKYIDQMIVILPFESKFYQQWDYKVHYVGHPLVKVINEFQVENSKKDNEKKTIALLPGSRKQEISIKLPIMLQMASKFKDYHFVVAKAPGVDDDFYDSFLQDYNNVEAISGGTYAILNNAYAALVTSGTATLETALFNIPQVVCYKGNKLSYLIAKMLIKIKYISLVNLIMDKEIVKELIQDDFNPQQLEVQLSLILETKQRETIQHEYELLRNMLSLGGDASYNAASIILGDA